MEEIRTIRIALRFNKAKQEGLRKLLHKLMMRFTFVSFVSTCVHSILELAETGEQNDFLKTITKIGKEV